MGRAAEQPARVPRHEQRQPQTEASRVPFSSAVSRSHSCRIPALRSSSFHPGPRCRREELQRRTDEARPLSKDVSFNRVHSGAMCLTYPREGIDLLKMEGRDFPVMLSCPPL